MIKKILTNTKFKVLILFLIAFLPRILNLSGHDIFVDEISWMPRAKDIYGTIRTRSWNPNLTMWWLSPTTTEAIGLPVTTVAGFFMNYLAKGYSIHSLNLFQDFVAGRLVVVILGSIFVPAFYLLLRKFVDDKIAFITSLLFAIDSIAIALSRWLQHDTALMSFSIIALMLFLFNDKKITLIFSSFFTALAILTKPQGFLLVFTLVIYYVVLLILKRKVNFKRLLFWLILSAAFTTILFPYLWKNPIGNMLNYLMIQVNHVDEGNLTLFNGTITYSPPWYYYFAIFPFRIPESVLLGFIVGIAAALINLKKGITKNRFFVVGVIYSIMYLILMSFSDKKLGIRYLLPIWPYIYLLATSGLVYISKHFKKNIVKIVFWILVSAFPIWGVLKFSPVYYLYHNNFISPAKFQNYEAVGYCDSVKPALEYLGPELHENIKLMLVACDAAINYYTGYTIQRVQSPYQKPEYIIQENLNGQTNPQIYKDIENAGYKEIKEIDFRGLILARIYKPGDK